LGIYQSIGAAYFGLSSACSLILLPGFKEFRQYLSEASPSDKTFATAVEDMKLSTRRYAKRQVAWIRNKLLPAFRYLNELTGPSRHTGSHIYVLDATREFRFP
jgi:tRNA dimethylallyltransferase